MPVYDYKGERVEAVQFSTYSDHPYVRQLQPGEFAAELGDTEAEIARRARDERTRCAALDQPGEEPRLVRPGDMIVSRPAEHGELRCEIVPPVDFHGAAKYVGVRNPELLAGMSASPEQAELRKKRIDMDLERQLKAREDRRRETKERALWAEQHPDKPLPLPKQTSGEPGSPQAATRGRPGEDGTSREKEATPQRAGADGNRSTKPDEPDPDAQRAPKGAPHGKHRG